MALERESIETTVNEGPELPMLLKTLGWSVAHLSRLMGVTPNTAYRWAHGEARTPGAVIAYLKLVLLIRDTTADLKKVIGDV